MANKYEKCRIAGTYKGQTGGEIFICTDWYKQSLIFLSGQHGDAEMCTEL
jgi:hypothetical protein